VARPEWQLRGQQGLARLGQLNAGILDVCVPAGEFSIQLAGERDQRQRPRLEPAGVRGALAGALPCGLGPASAQPAFDLGLVRTARTAQSKERTSSCAWTVVTDSSERRRRSYSGDARTLKGPANRRLSDSSGDS
jgi:hypothetical protein